MRTKEGKSNDYSAQSVGRKRSLATRLAVILAITGALAVPLWASAVNGQGLTEDPTTVTDQVAPLQEDETQQTTAQDSPVKQENAQQPNGAVAQGEVAAGGDDVGAGSVSGSDVAGDDAVQAVADGDEAEDPLDLQAMGDEQGSQLQAMSDTTYCVVAGYLDDDPEPSVSSDGMNRESGKIVTGAGGLGTPTGATGRQIVAVPSGGQVDGQALADSYSYLGFVNDGQWYQWGYSVHNTDVPIDDNWAYGTSPDDPYIDTYSLRWNYKQYYIDFKSTSMGGGTLESDEHRIWTDTIDEDGTINNLSLDNVKIYYEDGAAIKVREVSSVSDIYWTTEPYGKGNRVQLSDHVYDVLGGMDVDDASHISIYPFADAPSETYTITFDVNEGAGSFSDLADQSAGATVSLSSYAPTRDGYTFTGWTSSSTMRTANASSYTVDASDADANNVITLTANWQAADHDVTLAIGGGTLGSGYTALSAVSATQKATGDSVSVPSTGQLTWTGHTLTGFTVTQGGATYDDVTPGGSFTVKGGTNGNAPITVTAKWATDKYTITYSADSNGSVSPASEQKEYGANPSGATPTANSGYVFSSWDELDSNGNVIASGVNPTSYTVTKDLFFRANFAVAQGYTYVLGDRFAGSTTTYGESSLNPGAVIKKLSELVNDASLMSGDDPKGKTGWKFATWDVSNSATGASIATGLSTSDLYAGYGAIPSGTPVSYTFTASWQGVKHDITLADSAIDSGGSAISGTLSLSGYDKLQLGVANSDYRTGDAVPLPSQSQLTLPGYTLTGFKITQPGSGDVTKNPGDSYTVGAGTGGDAVVTITPVFDKKTYNVTFTSAGNGSVTPTSALTKDYGENVAANEYSQTADAGYDFDYWSYTMEIDNGYGQAITNGSGGTSSSDSAEPSGVEIKGKTVFTAHFEGKEHGIAFDVDGAGTDTYSVTSDGGVTVTTQGAALKTGDKVTLPTQDNLKKTGFTLTGFKVEQNGTTPTTLNPGATYTVTAGADGDANVTITAQWTGDPGSYKIIKHYQNVSDNGYTAGTAETFSDLNAGEDYTVTYANAYDRCYPETGFTYVRTEDKDGAPGKETQTIAGDGGTEFHVYYDRVTNDVMFTYTGTVPSDADPSSSALGTNYNNTGVRFGATVSIPAPTSSVATFGGWTTSPAGLATSGTFTMPASDVTYTGSWTLDKYTVTYTAGEHGDFADYVVNDVEAYAAAGAAPTFPNDRMDARSSENGTTLAPKSALGYYFDKWVATGGVTGDYADTTPQNVTIAGDTTFTAKYLPKSGYKVTYVVNGGTPVTNLTEADNVTWETVVITDGMTSKDGYRFDGWYTNEELTNPAGGTKYGQVASNDVDAGITLYAKWVGEEVTIDYDGNGAEGGTAVASQTGAVGTPIAVRANTWTHPGYDFAGWKVDDTQTVLQGGASLTPEKSSYTLTAQWEPHVFTVTYQPTDVDTQDATAKTQDFTYGVAQNLYTNPDGNLGAEWTRAGWRFDGWTDGTNDYEPGTDGSKITTVKNGSVVLAPKWVKQVTLSYDGNGSSDTVPASETKDSGSQFTIANGNGLTRAGYTFAGWNTMADGSGSSYASGVTATLAADTKLYAQWSEGTTTFKVIVHKQPASLSTKPSDYSTEAAVTIPVDGNATVVNTGDTATVELATQGGFEAPAGYTLNGSIVGSVTSATIAGDGSTELHLYYDLNPRTVTYAYSGAPTGYAPSPTSQSTASGATVVAQALPAQPDGYKPLGKWVVTAGPAADSGATVKMGDVIDPSTNFTMPDADVTLTLTFEKADFKVYYHVGDNGTIDSQLSSDAAWEVVQFEGYPSKAPKVGGNGADVTVNAAPVGSYSLSHWTYEDGGQTKTTSDPTAVQITHDTTFVAQFKHTFNITYAAGTHGAFDADIHDNGGNGYATDATVPAFDSTGRLDANNMPKSDAGYEFIGWTWMVGATKYASTQDAATAVGGSVTVSDLPSGPFSNYNCDLMVSSVHAPTTQTVTISLGNGDTYTHGGAGTEWTGAVPTLTASGKTGTQLRLPDADEVSRAGFTLVGWAKQEAPSAKYADPGASIDVPLDDSTTLIPMFEEGKARIAYTSAGNGTVSPTTEAADGIAAMTGTVEGSTPTAATGYEFDKWTVGEDGDEVDGSWVGENGKITPVKPESGWVDATYTAHFKKRAVTVKFTSEDGASILPAGSFDVAEGLEYKDTLTGKGKPVPAVGNASGIVLSAGHELGTPKWTYKMQVFQADGSTSEVTGETEDPGAVELLGDTVFTAKVNTGESTLLFNNAGGVGSYLGISKPYGTTDVVLPDGAAMTREGYTFDGWSNVDFGENDYAADYQPSGKIDFDFVTKTLYAHWMINKHSLTYNATENGGMGSKTTSDVEYGTEVTVSAFDALDGFEVPVGKHFKEWNTYANGAGTAYAASDTFDMPDADATLYAIFEDDAYKITYVQGSVLGTVQGMPTPNPITDVAYHAEGLRAAGALVTDDENFSFTSWKLTSGTTSKGTGSTEGSIFYGPNEAIEGIEGDITLTAMWTSAYPYTVRYLDADGTTVVKSEPAQAGMSGFLTAAPEGGAAGAAAQAGKVTVPENKKLVGWTTEEGSSATISDSATYRNLAGNPATLPLVVDLHPVFSLTGVTIQFDSNKPADSPGTMSGAMNNMTVEASAFATTNITANAFALEGYTFTGWSKNQATGGTAVADGALVSSFVDGATDSTPVTLYAQWEMTANKYKVTFINEGEQYGQNTGVAWNDPIAAPEAGAEPSQDDPAVIFLGWFTAEEGGTLVSVGAEDADLYGDAAIAAGQDSTADELKLYAHWSRDGARVNFNGNGNTSGAPSKSFSSTVVPGSVDVISTDGIHRTGYEPDGWATNTDGTGTQYAGGTSQVSFGSDDKGKIVDLYVKWVPLNYTVTYDANGGTLGTGTADKTDATWSGADLLSGAANNPTRTGYAFDGWFTAATGGTQVTGGQDGTAFSAVAAAQNISGDDDVTHTVTLYAHWTAVSDYIVAYDTQGGNDIASVGGLSWGSYVPIPSVPTKAGYTFAGWHTDAACTSAQVLSTTLYGTAAEAQFGADVEPTDKTVTLYADWTENEGYSVIYELNGGTGLTKAATELRSYDATTATLSGVMWTGSGFRSAVDTTAFTRPGYTFNNWYTDELGTELLTDAMTFSALAGNAEAESVRVYANWTEKSSYTLVYDTQQGSDVAKAAGGAYEVSDNQITGLRWRNDSDFKSAVTEPTRAGYTFGGWYTQPDGPDGTGTQVTDSTRINEIAGNVEPANGTVTVYAYWEPKTYTVVYDANISAISVANPDNASVGWEQAVPEPAMTAPSTEYQFDHWYYLNADGQPVPVDGASFKQVVQAQDPTLDADTATSVTLYGSWIQAVEYTVTHHKVAADGSDAGVEVETKTAFPGTAVQAEPKVYAGYQHDAEYDGALGTPLERIESLTAGANMDVFYVERTDYTVVYDKNMGSDEKFAHEPADSTKAAWYANQTHQAWTSADHLPLDAAGEADVPVRAGWTFVEWNTKADGSGDAVTADMKYSELANGNADTTTVTLYAIWKEKTSEITYKVSADDVSTAAGLQIAPNDGSAAYGTDDVTEFVGQATRFQGNAAEVTAKVDAVGAIAGTTVAGYHFEKWTVDLSYISPYDSTVVRSASLEAQSLDELVNAVLGVQSAYADGEVDYSTDQAILPGVSDAAHDNLFLQATYTAYAAVNADATLTFTPGEGEYVDPGDTYGPVTQPWGTGYKLPDGSKVTRDGYEFGGWVLTDGNGNKTTYKAGDEITLPEGGGTLQPNWIQLPFTITGGGKVDHGSMDSIEEQLEPGSTMGALRDVIEGALHPDEGYYCDGFYISYDGGETWQFVSIDEFWELVATGDMQIKPHFAEEAKTVVRPASSSPVTGDPMLIPLMALALAALIAAVFAMIAHRRKLSDAEHKR